MTYLTEDEYKQFVAYGKNAQEQFQRAEREWKRAEIAEAKLLELKEAAREALDARSRECRAQAALTVARDNYKSGQSQEEKAWIAAAVKASEAERRLAELAAK